MVKFCLRRKTRSYPQQPNGFQVLPKWLIYADGRLT